MKTIAERIVDLLEGKSNNTVANILVDVLEKRRRFSVIKIEKLKTGFKTKEEAENYIKGLPQDEDNYVYDIEVEGGE